MAIRSPRQTRRPLADWEDKLLRQLAEQTEEHVFTPPGFPEPGNFLRELRKQLTASGNAAQAETTVADIGSELMPMDAWPVRHTQCEFMSLRPRGTDVIEPARQPVRQIITHDDTHRLGSPACIRIERTPHRTRP